MDFLTWHYTKGIDIYLAKWIHKIRWVNHYYSPTLLLKTLFSPWKRLVEVNTKSGFSFERYFETLMFNLISSFMGALVRSALLFASFWIFLLVAISGMFGFLLWLIVPVVGIPDYLRYKKQPDIYAKRLAEEMNKDKSRAIELFYESEAGKYILMHLGISREEFVANAKQLEKDLNYTSLSGLYDLVNLFIHDTYEDSFLRDRDLEVANFLDASYMWDVKNKNEFGSDESFGRPGLALDLVYGYTPTLTKYSNDLSIPQTFSHRLIGREDLVSRMDRVLSSGNSVLLMGQSGVGKKTAILEFEERAANGKLGPTMAYQKVMELDYNSLLSGSSDANTKKMKLAEILSEAANAGNIILMIRDLHRLTNSDVEGYDFTDTFDQYLEKKTLRLIAVSTPNDYERFISRNVRLRKYLKVVEINPPDMEEVMKILLESAIYWENISNITIKTPVLRKILVASDKYITEAPFPEKALELLESVLEDCKQRHKKTVDVDDANKILAEKTGISFSYITKSEKDKLTNLEAIIHEGLIGQESAVSLIAKSLRGRSIGAKDDNRPIGSFLFLGPTGVGKTETAKILAKVYFGSEDEIIRFDMAEYQGDSGLDRLIGSTSKNTPGTLTTSIKNKPASLLLLDELEKATPEIKNLFLTLLDEGYIVDAFGNKVIGRNLFIVATSNAGAEYVRSIINRGVKGSDLQQKTVEYVMAKGLYSPEFINRFDGVVVYEPLTPESLEKVASLMLAKLSNRMKDKNIHLKFTTSAVKKLASDGYDPAFGARPMRRIVDLTLSDLLGRALLTDHIKSGDKVELSVSATNKEFTLTNLN